MSNIKLSVIVPSYNESAEIKTQAIEEIDAYLKKQKYSNEVLIVDDKSTNSTLELVKAQIKNKKNFTLIENEHGGKAITVMTGLLKSKGEIALFTDMDQATPISETGKLVSSIENGSDIAIGSRGERKDAPFIRKLASLVFVILRNLILGLPIKDTQCGFKAFKREVVNTIFPEMLKSWQNMKAKGAAVNAGFDIETLYLAKSKGFKITEVEVEWHHVQNEKQVQLVQDAVESVKDMLRIRLNSLSR